MTDGSPTGVAQPARATLSFRAKLLLAMMVVVAAVTVTTLAVTQRFVERSYARVTRERFTAEADAFAAIQEARLAAARSRVRSFARSVRLVAAVNERDVALLYKIAVDELRTVLQPDPDAGGLAPATFFRVLDGRGAVLPPPTQQAGLIDDPGRARWEPQVAAAARAAVADRVQHIGYLDPRVAGRRVLHEVIVTPIVDRFADKAIGALAIGFPAEERNPAAAQIPRGVWLGRRLYLRSRSDAGHGRGARRLRDELRTRIPAATGDATSGRREEPAMSGRRKGLAASGDAASGRKELRTTATGDFDVVLDGRPYRVFYRPLHEESRLPPAYLVGLHSLAAAREEQRRLRDTILRVAAVALLLALAASMLLARTLAVPLRALVAGAGAIARGDLTVRVPVRRHDEVGRVAAAFNEMVAGLALKERYRSVLDVIADKAVAERLLAGAIALGGEMKEVSVLFCDIRGFTTLSERMPPHDVIAMLNEHMTALTAIVHAHHGIVDKFVGDALMAVFGAPTTTGDDALAAVDAARQMVDARRRLNATASPPLEIGVGIASGSAVAGCMGSAQRMNYTVVGERVNLAARLCAQAGPMQVLIDDTTRARVDARVAVEPVGNVRLKGFAAAVAVFRLRDVASAESVA